MVIVYLMLLAIHTPVVPGTYQYLVVTVSNTCQCCECVLSEHISLEMYATLEAVM